MLETRKVRGIDIACWTNRAEWKPEKRFVLFVHGSGGDHTNWVYQYSHLGKDFNIAVLELPGHGASGGKGEADVPSYVEWVKDAIAAFEVSRPVVVGHSLGAAIALTFAIRHGELLSGVVPVGGGLKMPVNPAILEGLRKDPLPIIEMAAKISVAKSNRERFSALLVKGLSSAKAEVIHGDFSACDRLDIVEAVKAVRLPTLVICGDEDKMTPPSLSEEIHRSIPGSRLVIIPGAGHFVMMEQAEAFNEALRSFVTAL